MLPIKMLTKNILSPTVLKISYKLLHDLLFILLIFLAATLLAEGLLPGIVSSHIGISKIILAVAGTIFLISRLSSHPALETKTSRPALSKKTIYTLSLFGIILVLNGLLKVGVALNLAITALTVIVAFLVYTLLIKENAS